MKIYQAAKLLGVSSMTLRRIEKLGAIKPQRDRNGWRNYETQDIDAAREFLFPPNPHPKKSGEDND